MSRIVCGLLICKSELTSWSTGKPADFLLDEGRKTVELVEIAGLKRVLVKASAWADANLKVLRGVQEDVDSVTAPT